LSLQAPMSLTAGACLGPYEIVAALGAGGMGEVYKARDTRLDRSVAIKVLPAHVSADPDRRARFEREAKTIAGLNDPHICTLYDVGEHASASSGQPSLYLVMEHLTGETLAARLQKGPLPLEQALTVATEIADALSTAHRQGVIHRDLKPGNVMLTKAGAKLLDFGLAKLTGHGEQPAAVHLVSAPTQSTPLTAEGMSLGTLQYMAPEQLEGKAADARTDLWALGAILYEMVTGKRSFEGTSAASLIGNIMNADPPALATLQPLTPPAVDRLVRQCLAKAPDDRPDTAHDVANELRGIRESSGVAAATGGQPRRARSLPVALAVAGGLGIAVAASAVTWLMRPSPPRALPVRVSLEVSPADELNTGGYSPQYVRTPGGARTAFTWTPDGQALVFVGRKGGVQQLYLRRLDAAEARLINGTEGAQVPAVSPDGQWIAFWADAAIKKVPFGGGPVTDLATSISFPRQMVWDTRDTLFHTTGRIWKTPPDGAPTEVGALSDGELSHLHPWPLPGGRALLYTVRKREWSWGDEEVVAQTLPAGGRKVLLKDAADARYVPTGRLVFLRRGVLYAVAFDAERLEVRGPEVAVLDGVAQALTAGSAGDVTGAGQFAISPTGTLAWVPSPVVPYEDRALVTVDRRGQVAVLPAPVRSYYGPVRVSGDGRRLAVVIRTLAEAGLWVYDLTRGTLTPLNREGESLNPAWTRDGQRVGFCWLRDGRPSLAMQAADGTAPPQVLMPGFFYLSSSTPDGRQLAAADRRGDVETVTVENGKASAQPLWQTPATEWWPEFSPDGRWLVYGSNVSGRFEVYVRPYPGPGPAEQVSLEGGESPAWHPNGREVFFVTPTDPAGKQRMLVVDFIPGSPPRIGRPRELFEFSNRDLILACTPLPCYSVAPDGERFYAMQWRTPAILPAVTHINLVLNWFEELKAKVPIK
jgi:Tol biopolymer transport system component